MCVIAAKPAGVDMPSDDRLMDMWYANPDGAGFMYADNGVVRIRKGFMELNKFMDAIDELRTKYDLTSLPLVLHFRITTHGGTKPENCHPFPISDSIGVLSKLESKTSLGVAHNGIINITPRKGISDTMEYIATQIAPLYRAVPKFYKNKDLMEMINNATRSKLAFLTDKGGIYTVGAFVEEDGVLYSNKNFEYRSYRDFGYGCYDPWDKGLTGWDDTVDYNPDNYCSKYVMWITDGYIRGGTEEPDPYDSYAIDKNNDVYRYDYTVDALVKIPGATAYTNNGTFARFKSTSPDTLLELVYRPNKRSDK